MRLYEHEAAGIFADAGIRVPGNALASSPEQAASAAGHIGFPAVLKAQILSGGRGLSGGVMKVFSTEEAHETASKMLGTPINGMPVKTLMVVRYVDFHTELYLGVTVDGYTGKPTIMASTAGGVQIEKVARKTPEKIVSAVVDPQRGLYPFEARRLLNTAGFPPEKTPACADTLVSLFQVFQNVNAITAEINPLVICADGRPMALDAKLEIDDSALFRLGDGIPKDPAREDSFLEKKGREIGVTYVELDGDIGIISSGAGLGMATMDIIGKRLRPANFLETGGGITQERLYQSMELIMMKKGVRAVFINLYGGINPIQEGAKGIVRYVRDHGLTIPIVAKALGNRQEETWGILRAGGIHVVTQVATEHAVDRLIELVEAKG